MTIEKVTMYLRKPGRKKITIGSIYLVSLFMIHIDSALSWQLNMTIEEVMSVMYVLMQVLTIPYLVGLYILFLGLNKRLASEKADAK